MEHIWLYKKKKKRRKKVYYMWSVSGQIKCILNYFCFVLLDES